MTTEIEHERFKEMLGLVRDDGRPEVYDVMGVPPAEGYGCFVCASRGETWKRHNETNQVFMTSPINTPGNVSGFVCREHLPENAVIYNPADNTCRNKAGDNVWKE